MTRCARCRTMMMEALYGELDAAEKAEFDKHLRACPDCAAEYSVLGATLGIMDRKDRRDPGPEFWDGYWDRLERRMTAEAAVPASRPGLGARLRRLFAAAPRWAYQAAAAVALVAVGVLIGRSLLAPPGGNPALDASRRGPAAVVNASNEAEIKAGDFLDRSKVLLLGLVNFDPAREDPYALDIPRTQALSRDLVTQASDIQSGLTDPRQRKLRDLVADLQVIMMQIANLGAGQEVEGVEMVRRGVETKGIFLKIDLTKMAAASAGAAGTAGKSAKPGPSGKIKV